MRYRVSIAVRGRVTRPIHFCFEDEESRDDLVAELVDTLREAADIDVVIVGWVGFLKRDFISFAMEDDEDTEGPDEGEEVPPTDPVEAAVSIAVAAKERAE